MSMFTRSFAPLICPHESMQMEQKMELKQIQNPFSSCSQSWSLIEFIPGIMHIYLSSPACFGGKHCHSHHLGVQFHLCQYRLHFTIAVGALYPMLWRFDSHSYTVYTFIHIEIIGPAPPSIVLVFKPHQISIEVCTRNNNIAIS